MIFSAELKGKILANFRILPFFYYFNLYFII